MGATFMPTKKLFHNKANFSIKHLEILILNNLFGRILYFNNQLNQKAHHSYKWWHFSIKSLLKNPVVE